MIHRPWNKQRRCRKCGAQRHKRFMQVAYSIKAVTIRRGHKRQRTVELPKKYQHNVLECVECPR